MLIRHSYPLGQADTCSALALPPLSVWFRKQVPSHHITCKPPRLSGEDRCLTGASQGNRSPSGAPGPLSGTHSLFPLISMRFLFCHLLAARGQPREHQAAPCSAHFTTCHPPQPRLTCSEFSGYSCRTARAPRTWEQQKCHCLTNAHGIRSSQPSRLHSLNAHGLRACAGTGCSRAGVSSWIPHSADWGNALTIVTSAKRSSNADSWLSFPSRQALPEGPRSKAPMRWAAACLNV